MANENKKINIGIGFVTGRKNFKRVIKAYLDNFNQCGVFDSEKYRLHLFIAYDLDYVGTKVSDYNIIEDDILANIDSALYISNALLEKEAAALVKKKVICHKEQSLLFGQGYAMKRNAVLYFALKHAMDCLIFLDDDEYPIANIRMENSILWKGQDVLAAHIQNILQADMTHGYHCGYISPIPAMKFNSVFCEDDFRLFIETISNDIITWDSVREKMSDGGVTYADLVKINSKEVSLVKEVCGMKFISGANLGLNLKDPSKLFPFYNPPGARGEDTFLSTCISQCRIRKVPCYTFHDGFLIYPKLLSGLLPNHLKAIDISVPANYQRFLNASIGWIRYKPLLLLITHRENYQAEISAIKDNLALVIPKMCSYFGNDDFKILLNELEFYDHHVAEHFQDFEDTKDAWSKVTDHICRLRF